MSNSRAIILGLLLLFRPLAAETLGSFSFDAPLSVLDGAGGFVGDFNNDGIPDIVALSSNPPYYPSEISIFLGNGNGTFQPPSSYPVGLYASSLVIGDFNGDGKADVVVLNETAIGPGGISVLLGNGNGTFQPAAFIALGGESPNWIASADLNGDGKLDLAITSNIGVLVLLGNGLGGFEAPVSYKTGGVYPSFVTVADFNRDGIPDLAVANIGMDNSGADVSILLGKGDGTFGAAIPTVAGYGPIQLIAADFNGDGKPDLAVGDLGLDNKGTVAILLGKGDGTFEPPTYFSVGVFNGISAGDVNNDGHIDLVVANTNLTTILLGNGDGTFTKGQSFQPVGGVLADFNNDGNLDIESGGAILFGNGHGEFQHDVTYPVANQPVAVALGDFNGDGIPDAALSILGNPTRAVAILLGKSDGSFGPPAYFLSAKAPGFIAIADFNRDGKLDLVVTDEAYQANRIIILLGNGDGTFQAPKAFSTGGSPGQIAIADFNGDGIPDLAVTTFLQTGDQVAVLFGNGDGTFQTAVQYTVGTGSGIAAADFSGDGKPDLAVVGDNVVSVLLNQGNGTFAQQVDYPVGTTPVGVTAGDLNGDGRPDLAVANSGSNNVSILINDAGGYFLPAVAYPTDMKPTALAISDFNGDGVPDLAVSCIFASSISFLAGTGDGAFAKPASFGIGFSFGSSSGSLAVADLNGDGKPDVVSPSGLNAIAVLLNESAH